MKKILATRIKKLKLWDYLRQFSIVVGGVLLTLWLSAGISEASKQREVRQAMQLIILELRDNLKTIQTYKHIYNDEKRIAIRISEEGFSIENLPQDTISYYSQRVGSGLGRPYNFSTDALEMLKTSGLTSHITDKQKVFSILQGYTSIREFDNTIKLYYDMRKDALLVHDDQINGSGTQVEGVSDFSGMLANPRIQIWIQKLPRCFNDGFFKKHEKQLEELISQLEAEYK